MVNTSETITIAIWGQGVLFPHIIFMSFIGLSVVCLKIKYLECIHRESKKICFILSHK